MSINVVSEDQRETGPTPGLDLASNRPFERRFWTAQRIIWIVLDVFLLTTLAGFIGSGPLSKGKTDPLAPAVVTYERIARVWAPGAMQIELSSAGMAPQKTFVRFNEAMVERMTIQQIWPQPLASQPIKDGIRFAFATDPNAAPGRIRFTLKPGRPGIVAATVTVEGHKPIRFRQYVLP